MKRLLQAGIVTILLLAAPLLRAQELPKMPQPQKEHQWLQQLVGEWESEGEAFFAPDQPPIKCEGIETVRAVGNFWISAESKNTIMNMPVTGVLTLGYDPRDKKFVGTWIDSVQSYLWKYDGSLQEENNTLTLLTEGPGPQGGDKLIKFKEVLELKDKDHKVFTSYFQDEDGQWQRMVVINYQRKP